MKRNEFHNLVQEHKNRVFSYCYYFLKNREDAEDVTQEVFIRFWNNRESIHRKKLGAWLLTVAHHRCIDLIRQKRAALSRQRMTKDLDPDALASTHTHESDPELHLEFTETQKVLLSAMESLPEKTKSIIMLHYFQGLKYETISEMLDTKVATIKVAVHRGKRLLRDALMESFPERMAV